jgi:SpoVK/Ycf46/Vps4 family AAA+-type ATPase
MKELTAKPFNPRMGQLISHESLQDEKLIYNKKELSQINTLTEALQHDRYTSITAKMVENNMKPGFTVLMYGFPGTGKTSSVKSLARKTGRHIFMVDIPKINSKWVGESEKNLSRLFDEYQRARKHFDKDPILLFNEADAILGKRISANTSVDKMNNSMQNILLQELEDFEGIFIATTNLADQLDGAFDRRLLYKLEFHKPEDQVRIEILRNAFPDLDDELLETINTEFPLTGGQIANVKKKILVKKMLEHDIDMENVLLLLCEEEFMLSKTSNRTTIGFATHKKAS